MNNLMAIINRQRAFSLRTFGPGQRDQGIIDHIKKELEEIKQSPGDLEEWIDVIILALDGAWRNGFASAEIVEMLNFKQMKNENRQWPDWKTAKPGKAIEHIKIKYKCGCSCDPKHGHRPSCMYDNYENETITTKE